MMHAPALTLTDLAEAIRAARAAAAAAFESGFDRVREIGDRLKIAKQMAGHGRWGEFLKTCELNDRTARQYIQFAELAAKTAPGTDLTGLSIKAAIKLLSPPKPPETHQEAEAPEAPASEASPEVPAPAPEDDPSDLPEGADDKFDPTPPVEDCPRRR